MSYLRLLSSSEQVADYLRNSLINRKWTGMMPGGHKLAKELGVGVNTIETALKQLEKEGSLINQGRRRGRCINPDLAVPNITGMRVSLLLSEATDRNNPCILELIHALEQKRHTPTIASKALSELGDKVERIERLVGETQADAWVVCSADKNVLTWLSEQETPCFALAGRNNQIPIPSISPDKLNPLRYLIRKLVDLGHDRIVNICRPMRRSPRPGRFEREFLTELEKMGINTGPYNLPNWEEDTHSFHECLESLFRFTPPTALITDESVFIPAILQFAIRSGLRIPEDFSLICTDPDPSFAWCKPSVAHISWDSRPITRRIVQWVDAVAEGRKDLQKSFSKAEFVEGGTIGPAPTSRTHSGLPAIEN